MILNEASLDDFMRLPGVGEKRAQALLALREKLGRFKKFNDLLRVKGIGHKTVKKFAELAVLDRPPPAPAETGSGPSLSVPAAPKVAAPATEPAH